MAALGVEAACRTALGLGVRRVRLLPRGPERRYHRCPVSLCLHRVLSPAALTPGTRRPLLLTSARYQSTVIAASSQAPALSEAHLPPALPAPEAVLPLPLAEVPPTFSEALGQGEQTLAELGLGANTPVGMVQNFLEFLHLDVGLPWWGAIVAGTVLARVLVFPLIVKGQREAAKLNNHMPQITSLTTRMNEAKRSGNKFDCKSICVPAWWLSVSLHVGIRVPTWWLSVSLHVGIRVSACGYPCPCVVVIRVSACGPLTSLPQAVFTYWVTSNVFSLAQVGFLRIPAVRSKLRIPERIKHDQTSLPQQQGFLKSLKSGWNNAQAAQQLAERERRINNHLDIAAKGPLRQTFSHNPLQQREATVVSPSKPKSKPWQDTIG
ncbi:LOW QUALITY PROTEIN: mitochondrial inner membrane protein OXA1L [Ascaphus truei]|uniref:LOW QUALITY PROTEIN: mitochondrial inner membrane protein OXA1L n=1 Tax=Ascaphus truei TaxID=8439 RepID=UPI003F59C8FE